MSLVFSEDPNFVKRICFLGAGYVGGPTGAVIADRCPDLEVVIADMDCNRIRLWNQGPLPIYEPGLEPIVIKCRNNNLFFTSDIKKAINEAEVIFICVNTPTKLRGLGAGMAAEVKTIETACRSIKEYSRGYKIVVEKSTVPCGTAANIANILHADGDDMFDVLSNPEFLAEGTAINDLNNPDRVLIGALPTRTSVDAQKRLASVYARWVPPNRILLMSAWSSELSKLAANAMLAQRISSINSLSSVCEAIGADIEEVSLAIGKDHRIGKEFLRAGPGFGGSCFQKDILNLIYLARSLNLDKVAEYWEPILRINSWQKERFVHRIIQHMYGTVHGKRIAVLGFAFKKDTGDTRGSPAIGIVAALLEEGADVYVYDPVVSAKQIHDDLGTGKVTVWHDAYEACIEADAMVVCTAWDEFNELNFARIYDSMRKPAYIFDGCLVLDRAHLKRIGFSVFAIGKA